jgi:hypothetical protein
MAYRQSLRSLLLLRLTSRLWLVDELAEKSTTCDITCASASLRVGSNDSECFFFEVICAHPQQIT